MGRSRVSSPSRGLVQLRLGLLDYPERPPTLSWVRERVASRWTWRAGDPPFWLIEEPPEGRKHRGEAESRRRWLDQDHPDRAGDWELWYSTPSRWLAISFHPTLETAQEAAELVVADSVRMAELDAPQDGGEMFVCAGCRRGAYRAPGTRRCSDGVWCTDCRRPGWPGCDS